MQAGYDKSGECGRESTSGGTSERVIDRRVPLPTSFRTRRTYDVWVSGGPGPLLSRLPGEHEQGRTPFPLTAKDIAYLIELFQNEPLPAALRIIAINELGGARHGKPGPKSARTTLQQIELALLPATYERALRVATRYRPRLARTDLKRMRWQTARRMPTQNEIVETYIKNRLPSMRKVTVKTMINLVSAMGSSREKKARAKSAKR